MRERTRDSPVRVLLVEDDDADAELILADLARGGPPLEMRRVATADAAMLALREGSADVVLLDLTLPDSDGVDTIDRVRRVAPDTPLVVLTGHADEGAAREALRRGAQDYLVKGDPTPAPVRRSLEHALERQTLMNRVSQLQAEAEHLQELRELERIERAAAPGARAQATPLRERDPGAFARCVDRYARDLEAAWRDRAYDVARPAGHGLAALAADLGRAGASPRDVVDVHRAALDRGADAGEPGSARRRREESRWTLLELMGELADHYRLGTYRGAGGLS